MTMQVQIRQQGGGDVSLDDCARFSGSMEDALEASPVLSESYVLEISSPGIDEYLSSDKDFLSFRSFPVEVCFLAKGTKERQSFEGLLLERSEQHVHINIKGRIKKIPREDVNYVRLTSSTG